MAITGAIVAENGIKMNSLIDHNHGHLVYSKPWCKIVIYQIGIVFGMLFYEYRHFEKGKLSSELKDFKKNSKTQTLKERF